MSTIMIAKILWYFISLILINGQNVHDCNSEIFCHGDILEAMQFGNPPMYDDPADFVEMKLKNSPRDVLNEFETIKSSVRDRSLLKLFAKKNFVPDIPDKCSNFDSQKLRDLKIRVLSKTYKDFVSSITEMWSELIVQTSDHVEKNPDYHTLVHLPNCFVKSDEFTATTNYYDNYWIVRGLLSSGLTEIAAGIIENYTYLIRKHSFVPHSNRVYSSRRTQLPLLAFMMESYYEETNDTEFLLRNLEAMEKEFVWWTKNRYFWRVINQKMYKVFQFYPTGDEPRPEKYKEDYQLAINNVFGSDKRKYFFSAIRALDEAALGFCSRFKRDRARSWASINILDLIPVELNSVLQRYAFLLGQWFKDVKNDARAGRKYEKFSQNIGDVMDNVLWNKRRHMWFDWDLSKRKHQFNFSPTNLMPLFTVSYLPEKTAEYSNYSLRYLRDEGIIDAKFKPLHWIIPYSTSNTGSVWDFPYGSTPDTLFLIEGLSVTTQKKSEKLALELAKALVKTIFVAYVKKETLYKQYSAVELAKGVNERIGSKISNAGYAWTNAAVLLLFKWFGDSLDPTDYKGFIPSLKHMETVEQKIEKRKREKAVESDDDYEPSLNTAVSSQKPTQQKNESKQTSPSKQQRPKKKKKTEGRSESPPNKAAKSKQPIKRRRSRSKSSDRSESETPSNETVASEQPRKSEVVRKASKRFVDEAEPMDETAPTVQTSEKKRSRKSSQLSDDEESMSPSGEIGLAERTEENKG